MLRCIRLILDKTYSACTRRKMEHAYHNRKEYYPDELFWDVIEVRSLLNGSHHWWCFSVICNVSRRRHSQLSAQNDVTTVAPSKL